MATEETGVAHVLSHATARVLTLKLTEEEKAEWRNRIAKSARERDKAKLDLVSAARAVAEKPWPDHLLPDVNEDAWFHRKSEVNDFIEKRGGFSHHVALLALTDSDWETKETVATWLRSELKHLREAEAQPGAAPVRRRQAVSRIDIADVAVEMLECLAGDALVCLFQELLNVDRRRRALAEIFSQMERAAEAEASALLQGDPLGVRQLATLLNVAPSTVTRWRKASNYWKRVEMYKDVWGGVLREDYFEAIKSSHPEATEAECFQRAFQRYHETIPQRRSRSARSRSAAPKPTKQKRAPDSR